MVSSFWVILDDDAIDTALGSASRILLNIVLVHIDRAVIRIVRVLPIEEVAELSLVQAEFLGHLGRPPLDYLVRCHILGTVYPLLVVKRELHIVHEQAGVGAIEAVIPEEGHEHVRDPDSIVERQRHEGERDTDLVHNFAICHVPCHVQPLHEDWVVCLAIGTEQIIS